MTVQLGICQISTTIQYVYLPDLLVDNLGTINRDQLQKGAVHLVVVQERYSELEKKKTIERLCSCFYSITIIVKFILRK